HGREPAPGPGDPQLRDPGVHAPLGDDAERVPHQLPLRGRPAPPRGDPGPRRRAGPRGGRCARVPARLPAGEPPARRDRARLVRPARPVRPGVSGEGARGEAQTSSPAVIAAASSTSDRWCCPTEARCLRPRTSMSIASTSVPVASRYGAPAVVAAASGPATAGATAPPRKRTPE